MSKLILFLLIGPLSITAQNVVTFQEGDCAVTVNVTQPFWATDGETWATTEGSWTTDTATRQELTRICKPKNDFKIYPNPAEAAVFIEVEWIEIFDVIGRLMYKGKGGEIDISNWSQGTYIVYRRSDRKTKKFVKV